MGLAATTQKGDAASTYYLVSGFLCIAPSVKEICAAYDCDTLEFQTDRLTRINSGLKEAQGDCCRCMTKQICSDALDAFTPPPPIGRSHD